MKPDFPNHLKALHQDLAALLAMPATMALEEPVRTRLTTLAASLAECAQQAAQMQQDHAARRSRIAGLARELTELAQAPAASTTASSATPPAEHPPRPDPSPAPAVPDQNTRTPPAAREPEPAAPAETTSGRFVTEGVSMISRSTVSPTCEAFVFAITDSAGRVQQMRIETYRIDNEIFVKTRSPLPGADKGWMRGKDSHGEFFLCYDTRIASIADKKLRMAAGFALS